MHVIVELGEAATHPWRAFRSLKFCRFILLVTGIFCCDVDKQSAAVEVKGGVDAARDRSQLCAASVFEDVEHFCNSNGRYHPVEGQQLSAVLGHLY